jgi:hypothetical protein
MYKEAQEIRPERMEDSYIGRAEHLEDLSRAMIRNFENRQRRQVSTDPLAFQFLCENAILFQ